MREMMTSSEVEKPSVGTILECDGLRMDCAAPHANTQACNSTYEGAGFDTETREQMGIEITLRSASAFSAPKNPWPKRSESETKTPSPRRRERSSGRNEGKVTVGISMVSPPQQLLRQP